MDDLQRLAAKAALDDMMRRGWMDICTIDKILKMTGGIPDRKDYEILSLLHCINFRDMPKELLRGLPVILQRVLGSQGLEFAFGPGLRGCLLEV